MALMKVQYVGISDVRQILPSELKAHGVAIDKKIVWDHYNQYSVVLDVNERFEQILRDQGHFTLTAVDNDGKDVEVVATASDPARVESVVANEEGKPQQKSSAK
jgi:hypothetical protein